MNRKIIHLLNVKKMKMKKKEKIIYKIQNNMWHNETIKKQKYIKITEIIIK